MIFWQIAIILKLDFDGFWWILVKISDLALDSDGFWLDFDWILMDFDGFWWILMDFDGFWWCSKATQNLIENQSKIQQKLIKKWPKIGQKSVKNRSKSAKIGQKLGVTVGSSAGPKNPIYEDFTIWTDFLELQTDPRLLLFFAPFLRLFWPFFGHFLPDFWPFFGRF